MSEDDRAAKAQRAKLMLKKRQQKKAGGIVPGPSAGASSPPPPHSRTLSPGPSEAPEDRTDLGHVFGKGDSDTDWLSSLPRVGSPPPAPPRASSSTVPSQISSSPTSPQPAISEQNDIGELRTLLLNQQQTIALLVSEKASLTASLERLEEIESRDREKETALQEERSKTHALESRVQELEARSRVASDLIRQLETTEKDLGERYREQERELQLTNATSSNLRAEVEQHRRRVRELEEQIQSDDRVEVLESSLKNNQDRADELEFQLSKLKQAHVTLRTERDDVESQLRVHRDGETLWKKKHSDLEAQHSATRRELVTAVTARDELLRDKSSLHSQADTAQKAFKQLQEKLSHAATELMTNTRQLQAVQAELRNANRRADEAVQTQKDLQAEGTNLMRSLDEMRPKIVELTGVKLELGDKVESLEHALRNRDSTIAQLESTIDELQYQKEGVEMEKADLLVKQDKERTSALSNSTELQKAFTEAQTDLESARASILALEAERVNHHQLISRQSEEIDRLTTLSRTQAMELSSIERDLEEREGAGEEQGGFLEMAQNEIESLRAEISSKDEEIERLREAVSSRPSPAALPRTLDEEMVGSLRQQQALELSAAHSNIRALETSVFEAEAKSHSLQKQVKAMEDELVQLRLSRAAPQPYLSPSRPSSGTTTNFPRSSSKPSVQVMPVRSVIDQELAPDTLHKRRVSLSMLKARIDSEVAAASAGSHLLSRPLSPMPPKHEVSMLPTVPEPVAEPAWDTQSHSLRRPQFLDESHVFWCHCCNGDLVIL